MYNKAAVAETTEVTKYNAVSKEAPGCDMQAVHAQLAGVSGWVLPAGISPAASGAAALAPTAGSADAGSVAAPVVTGGSNSLPLENKIIQKSALCKYL